MLRRFRWVCSVVVSVITAGVMSGCGSEKKDLGQSEGSIAGDSLPRASTLYVGGFQWGPAASFNPLAVTPAWPVTGNMNLIYEALFGYNLLDGSLKGIIGESYVVSDSMLEITLRKTARWHNGEPVSADDVVYSFNLHRKYTTNFSLIWNYVSDIRKTGPYSVVCKLSRENYNPLVLRDIIASVQILPATVFEIIEKESFETVASEAGSAPSNSDVLTRIREFRNDVNPVGSGPYTLHSYTNDRIVLRRVKGYWGDYLHGDRPAAPLYIVHRAYGSNDEFNAALENGDLDISQTFCPQIWDKFSRGVGTWYDKEPYYIPGIIPALLMSVTKEPFNDINFRRAVAHAIDYEKIRTQALYGYSPELRPGLIVPFGTEKEFFSEDDAAAFGRLYDPDKARAILKKAGYSRRADGMLDIRNPRGEPLRLHATCPAGWTDWEATIRIAVDGMREVGIDVEAKFLEYSVWDSNLKSGMFDFTMKTPLPEQAPSLPWSRFDQVMSSRNLLPVGEVMYSNEGRYRSEKADRLLAQIPKMSDPSELKAAYRTINRLFMDEMPIIPLMYRPWLFYQFSTKYWHNFPTEKNPYAPPQCLMVGAGVVALWGIEASASK